jgi:imidazole glycerol-phosphate synthase subunit HisF
MKNIRIIVRMDIKGPNLVKGIHMEGLRVLGETEYFAEYYYKNGADEIFYQDVVASLYERNNILDLVKKTANVISIPLTVGGGIRSLDDISRLLECGADKVSLNTSVIKDPNLIDKAAKKFGSSTITVAIETAKNDKGKYIAYIDNGREFTGIDTFNWAKEAERRGAGEILLTSIDTDGTGDGFDVKLISDISNILKIPLIAHGGAGNNQHVVDVIKKGNADAVALASLIHYNSFNLIKKKSKKLKNGNIEFLSKNKKFKTFEKLTLKSLKRNLIKKKISVRI